MRVLAKIALGCVSALVLFVAGALIYLFYCSRGLPDFDSLAKFAPSQITHASDACVNDVVVVPYDSIGYNFRNALSAAEVREDDPGLLVTEYRGFTGRNSLHRATLEMQISRSMFCTASRPLDRHLAEFRTIAQLERRFSRRDLFTIYANRVYFGHNLAGVQIAAVHYFGKPADQLSISESALLVGLLRSPSRYSPDRHPDRALERRNEVIDAELQNNSITLAEAQAAKSAPLGVLASASATTAR